MSLELNFFKNREIKQQSLLNEGYLSLDMLANKFKVTIDDLLKKGYLEPKKTNSITDSHRYQVSKKGKSLFLEIQELDLILIKPNFSKWLKI